MTQEEKAKRYDEALEELRGLLEGIREEKCKILEEDITSIFPELLENEDERIRKELIFYLGDMPEDTELRNGVTNRDVLVWLEKQGEQKPVISYDALREGIGHFGITQYQITNWLKKYVDVEKQVEQKQDPCDNCEEVMLNCHNFPCIKKRAFEQGKTALEAINEEKVDNSNRVEPKDYNSIDPHFGKPADKVEPKFHKNEWIITKKNNLYQVTAIIDDKYQLKYGDNYTVQKCADVDRCARLWDLTDAKDGDVIYSRHNTESFEWIGIFKSLDKENKSVHFYGFWNNVTKAFKVCWNEDFVLYDDFYPAAKEQRDKLEKAMADAGYTFDFEKKELKKIDNETEIPFGAKDSELQEDTYYIPKGFHAEIDGDKVVIKKGEKPTWSEEDEKTLNRIIYCIEHCQDEEIEAQCEDNRNVDPKRYESMSDWLKALRPQNTWKPSDAQMIALNDVITNGHLSNANERIFKGLQEQLKKLRGEKQ